MERFNKDIDNDHLMKSLDDLIAEDKHKLKKKTD